MTDSIAAAPAAANTPAAPAEADARKASAKAKSALDADFQAFLQLLTAQLENQDPLKPMESTEFVAQLATFSSVEQQVQSNASLEAILATLSGAASASLADWIGKEVRAAAPANFAGAPIEVAFEAPAGATRAELVVRDERGAEVSRAPVDPRSGTATWSGEVDGAPALHGAYAFTVESWRGEEALDPAPGRVFAEVIEVRLGEEGPELVFAGGVVTPVGEVDAVRRAGLADAAD